MLGPPPMSHTESTTNGRSWIDCDIAPAAATVNMTCNRERKVTFSEVEKREREKGEKGKRRKERSRNEIFFLDQMPFCQMQHFLTFPDIESHPSYLWYHLASFFKFNLISPSFLILDDDTREREREKGREKRKMRKKGGERKGRKVTDDRFMRCPWN